MLRLKSSGFSCLFLDDNDQKRKDNPAQQTNPVSTKSREHHGKTPSQMEERCVSERKSTTLSCGCQQPHEDFLGIDHYLNDTSSRPFSKTSKTTVKKGRASAVSNGQDHNHDDDDDVIAE